MNGVPRVLRMAVMDMYYQGLLRISGWPPRKKQRGQKHQRYPHHLDHEADHFTMGRRREGAASGT